MPNTWVALLVTWTMEFISCVEIARFCISIVPKVTFWPVYYTHFVMCCSQKFVE